MTVELIANLTKNVHATKVIISLMPALDYWDRHDVSSLNTLAYHVGGAEWSRFCQRWLCEKWRWMISVWYSGQVLLFLGVALDLPWLAFLGVAVSYFGHPGVGLYVACCNVNLLLLSLQTFGTLYVALNCIGGLIGVCIMSNSSAAVPWAIAQAFDVFIVCSGDCVLFGVDDNGCIEAREKERSQFFRIVTLMTCPLSFLYCLFVMKGTGAMASYGVVKWDLSSFGGGALDVRATTLSCLFTQALFRAKFAYTGWMRPYQFATFAVGLQAVYRHPGCRQGEVARLVEGGS